jgi:S-methylmethionine-dependent homocysteine/selenocysteine methylase
MSQVTPAYRALKARLDAGKMVLIDGGTGTELERRGAEMVDGAWCAMATLTAPDTLQAVHQDYIRSGATVITTNTFSTNRNMLDPAGLGKHFEEVNLRAAEIAVAARQSEDAQDSVAIGASMSHQVPLTPGAQHRDNSKLPSIERATERFEEMAQLFAKTDIDFIMLEMMSDPNYALPAIAAARRTGLPVWVGFSAREDANGRLNALSRPKLPIEELFSHFDFNDFDVAGVMHSKVHITKASLHALRKYWQGPMSVYPDSGYFKMPNWQFNEIIPPDEFTKTMQSWVSEETAQVIGGCCGLGVEHIAALRESFATELSS